jgi:serine/threonine protein kinase
LPRCLTKDVRQLLQHIGEARFALEHSGDATAEPITAQHQRPFVWITATAVLLLALASVSFLYIREAPSEAPLEMRTEINTPSTSDPVSFALSPDGRQIVFVAFGGWGSKAVVAAVGHDIGTALAGTEGASYPFWSPDSRSFGAMLYEMSTGSLPFRGDSSAVIFEAILNRAPVAHVRLNPEVPPDLERIISKALEKDRELRYQRAADLRTDMKRLKREIDSGKRGTVAPAIEEVREEVSTASSQQLPTVLLLRPGLSTTSGTTAQEVTSPVLVLGGAARPRVRLRRRS